MVAPEQLLLLSSKSLVGLLLLALAPTAVPASPLSPLHRRLMELIQGGEVIVAASPALCSARGVKTAWDSGDVRVWYGRTGACMLPFPTDLHGVVTRATQGLAGDLSSPAKVEALVTVLTEIRGRLEEASVQERLMFHSTAWELAHAVADAPGSTPGGALERLRCETLSLLRDTAYSPDEIGSLPATLVELPELAGVQEIATLAGDIAAQDSSIVEMLPPPEAHARLLLGRFTVRVFFTASTPDGRAAVKEYLTAGTSYDRMGRLALEVPDVESVLILYFNVLGRDFEVQPTDQVAFWQQVSFQGQLSLDVDEHEQAEDRVRFRSVRYQRNFDSDELVYTDLDAAAMSRTGFVDGMPSQMAAPVTTLRGACVRCHRRVISSFHPEEERELRFTPPLEVSGRALLTPEFTNGAEARFREWATLCR